MAKSTSFEQAAQEPGGPERKAFPITVGVPFLGHDPCSFRNASMPNSLTFDLDSFQGARSVGAWRRTGLRHIRAPVAGDTAGG